MDFFNYLFSKTRTKSETVIRIIVFLILIAICVWIGIALAASHILPGVIVLAAAALVSLRVVFDIKRLATWDRDKIDAEVKEESKRQLKIFLRLSVFFLIAGIIIFIAVKYL